MMDLLLPTTDAGVILQLAVVTVVAALVLWRIRRNPDARLFVIGLWVLSIGAMGVRALH